MWLMCKICSAPSEFLIIQASVFGADRCSWQPSGPGRPGCLFHEVSQSHDVRQCGHCELNLTQIDTYFLLMTRNSSWFWFIKSIFYMCKTFTASTVAYMFNPNVCQEDPSASAVEKASSNAHVTWLNQRKVRSFYRGVVAPDLRSGVNMLLQVRADVHSFHS